MTALDIYTHNARHRFSGLDGIVHSRLKQIGHNRVQSLCWQLLKGFTNCALFLFGDICLKQALVNQIAPVFGIELNCHSVENSGKSTIVLNEIKDRKSVV